MTAPSAPPGVAAQRTSLAWSRTALSTAVVAVVLGRLGLSHHRPLGVIASAVLLLDSVSMWVTADRRARDGASATAPLRRHAVLAATAVTALAAVLAAIGAVAS